jgi:antitoxin (DNA-binding transcriptional repressor) of toxin-antitoxin stability system
MSKPPFRSRSRAATRVPATEAAKNFGRLVDRVREERATFVIERGGTAVAQIAPVTRAAFTMADFKALLSDAAPVDEPYLRAVERAIERHNRPRARRNPWER